jgi:uncharacterized iron-regulated protein
MDLIEKELQKINFVVKQYADERESSFASAATTITNKLKKAIDNLAPNFALTSANSVRLIKHYFTTALFFSAHSRIPMVGFSKSFFSYRS